MLFDIFCIVFRLKLKQKTIKNKTNLSSLYSKPGFMSNRYLHCIGSRVG